tara:strand:- start:4101 stop:4433 length:333 start_codon:yes stop_codon:yes gene_type:complete
MGFLDGLRKGYKSTRKFGNKAMKGTSLGLKKASAGAEFLGSAIEKAGVATGQPTLVGAGQVLREGGQLAGRSAAAVEKLRTVRTSDDLASAIEDGYAIGTEGAELYAKVQ